MLLEKIEPGTLLVEVRAVDDDRATTIAAGILRTLWRPLPAAAHHLRSLESWLAAYQRNPNRRIAILADELDLPADRIKAWCFVHAVLNA